MLLVLLSAWVKRFSVSGMQDFLYWFYFLYTLKNSVSPVCGIFHKYIFVDIGQKICQVFERVQIFLSYPHILIYENFSYTNKDELSQVKSIPNCLTLRDKLQAANLGTVSLPGHNFIIGQFSPCVLGQCPVKQNGKLPIQTVQQKSAHQICGCTKTKFIVILSALWFV